MNKVSRALSNNDVAYFNSLDLFYSDEWNDLPDIHANVVNVDNINGGYVGHFKLDFIVNSQLALSIYTYGTRYVLSKHYSDFVYQWIITYMCDTFSLSIEAVKYVIVHEL